MTSAPCASNIFGRIAKMSSIPGRMVNKTRTATGNVRKEPSRARTGSLDDFSL